MLVLVTYDVNTMEDGGRKRLRQVPVPAKISGNGFSFPSSRSRWILRSGRN
ncbi:hypothetical protein HNR59_001786 [Aquamicrobium lusatiense]|uniref:Uncharacterized protein n=1 Tax=Aquamicrobium lusatiense TaxID=89772 RepID=A0A7W9S1M2_9HYPH|nr:hypothetical protein [Aquamicrobium lusatiense]